MEITTTIIIPNYNGLKFMDECIRSLNAQTYPNFRTLVVDNGSTDGSVEWLKEHQKEISDRNLEICQTMVLGSNRIKGEVVEKDPTEKGDRALLNFGHTLGHAIEKIYHYETYTHGQAVAVGMCLITNLAEQYGLTEAGCSQKIRQACERYHLPVELNLSPEKLVQNSLNDKKREKSNLNLILIHTIGKGYIYRVTVEEYKKFVSGEYQCK